MVAEPAVVPVRAASRGGSQRRRRPITAGHQMIMNRASRQRAPGDGAPTAAPRTAPSRGHSLRGVGQGTRSRQVHPSPSHHRACGSDRRGSRRISPVMMNRFVVTEVVGRVDLLVPAATSLKKSGRIWQRLSALPRPTASLGRRRTRRERLCNDAGFRCHGLPGTDQ